MAGATAAALLAILVAAFTERIPVNIWIILGLFVAAFCTAILRTVRRASLAVLDGRLIFQLWLVTRFVVSPALFLVAVALIGSLPFRSSASEVLLRALILLAIYGGAAFFATGILADICAMVKGGRRAPPSDD